jgi:hypothetical protein
MAVACAFDLMMLNSDDLRCKPFAERKAALRLRLDHPKAPAAISIIDGSFGNNLIYWTDRSAARMTTAIVA